MTARAAALILVALLPSCAINRTPASPVGQSSLDSLQAQIGTKKWFDMGLGSVCDDPELRKRCTKPKGGAATVVAVEPVRSDMSPQIQTVHGVYRVKLDQGRTGYISPIDFEALLASDVQHRKKVAEKADCDRRGGANIGMTAAQVEASCWGKPTRINRTITARGQSEQWVYGGNQYLYIDNGVVTAIQTH